MGPLSGEGEAEEEGQGRCDWGRKAQRCQVAGVPVEEGALSQGMRVASRSQKRQETASALEPPKGRSPAITLTSAQWAKLDF